MSSSPASRFVAVTPSDTVSFIGGECRALFVGVSGDVVAIDSSTGGSVTFKNVQSGSILPVQTKRVAATNTTASNIVALY